MQASRKPKPIGGRKPLAGKPHSGKKKGSKKPGGAMPLPPLRPGGSTRPKPRGR